MVLSDVLAELQEKSWGARWYNARNAKENATVSDRRVLVWSAEGGSRTLTLLRAHEFESCVASWLHHLGVAQIIADAGQNV